MWRLKPEMKKSVMQLPKPAMEQSTNSFNQDSKNCQSDRCFKRKCSVRPVFNDKNCQSANLM